MGRATLIGFSAVAMWAMLALFTDASGKVPPFLLSALTFAIGTLVGLAMRVVAPPRERVRIPLQVWVIGIAGLFGYHFFYFTALRHAPAVEASLIAYLWPLFIVLGSALMPGERLQWHHVAGATLGLAGTVLIVTKGGGVAFDGQYAFGYLMAGVCAFVWSAYSLLSRRFPAVPTSVVTWWWVSPNAARYAIAVLNSLLAIQIRCSSIAVSTGTFAVAAISSGRLRIAWSNSRPNQSAISRAFAGPMPLTSG